MQDQEEEEEGEEEGDWRAALRAVTGYDPRRYREVGGMGSDRAMEASVRDIMREERRSAVLGKKADMYVWRGVWRGGVEWWCGEECGGECVLLCCCRHVLVALFDLLTDRALTMC